MRPPHGTKSPFLLDYLKDHGLVLVEWSDMTDDYKSPGVDKIVAHIIRKAKPGGIIVLHDGDKNQQGSDRSQTVAALPIIIEKLQKEGYKFVTLPELMGVSPYK